MQYDLDRLLEIIESRLHSSLAMLKDAKNAYREIKAIREFGSVQAKIQKQLQAAPDLSLSVLK